MPWTAEEFKAKHNKDLTEAESHLAAEIANQVLHKTGREDLAIREANSVIKKNRRANK